MALLASMRSCSSNRSLEVGCGALASFKTLLNEGILTLGSCDRCSLAQNITGSIAGGSATDGLGTLDH